MGGEERKRGEGKRNRRGEGGRVVLPLQTNLGFSFEENLSFIHFLSFSLSLSVWPPPVSPSFFSLSNDELMFSQMEYISHVVFCRQFFRQAENSSHAVSGDSTKSHPANPSLSPSFFPSLSFPPQLSHPVLCTPVSSLIKAIMVYLVSVTGRGCLPVLVTPPLGKP